MRSNNQIHSGYPHAAIFCDQTGCQKTFFILNFLEAAYRVVFQHISVILRPTVRQNKTYQNRTLLVCGVLVASIVNPCERLHDYLRALNTVFEDKHILYIIEDCSGTWTLAKKNDMLSELFNLYLHIRSKDIL